MLETRCSEALEMTSQNTGLNLVMALSYSIQVGAGKCSKKYSSRCKAGKIDAELVNSETLEQYLCTSEFPDPELMIRTSGEYRISNFLLYQLAYAELYFTNTRWPDFRKENLYEAIIDFQMRERRFGKISEQVSNESDTGTLKDLLLLFTPYYLTNSFKYSR